MRLLRDPADRTPSRPDFCDCHASDKQSWRVSHQQTNAPVSKQHVALLPTTHWPELNHRTLPMGVEKENRPMCQERERSGIRVNSWNAWKALSPKAEPLPGDT